MSELIASAGYLGSSRFGTQRTATVQHRTRHPDRHCQWRTPPTPPAKATERNSGDPIGGLLDPLSGSQ